MLAARITSLVRNLSGRAAFCSKYLAACGDPNALLLPRNNQRWIGPQGARNFSSSKPFIVEMRGLDEDSTEEEVISFFRSLNVKPAKVRLQYDQSGRVAGACEVEFLTYGEAAIAMRKRNSFIGNRFIRLRLKPDVGGEGNSSLNANNSQSAGDMNFPDVSRGITKNSQSIGHFIRMKNLPHRITEQAIFDFFWPVDVRPVSVQQVLDNGRPTREFDLEFLTHEEAVRAMSKNNAYFGGHFIELTLKSTADGTPNSIQTSAEIPSTIEKQNIELH